MLGPAAGVHSEHLMVEEEKGGASARHVDTERYCS